MPSALDATVRRGLANGRGRVRTRHAARGHAPRFGRNRSRMLFVEAAEQEQEWRLSDDVKLYAQTFLAGFLFVSILIG